MGVTLQESDLDFGGVGKLIRALHNPVAADPAAPADSEIWFRSDTKKFRARANGVTQELAFISDVTAGGVSSSLWDPQSVVVAVADNTPFAQTLAASTILGRRAAGDVTAISYANLLADLAAIGINAQTLATFTAANLRDRATHTGAQLAATISDFNTAADARVAAGQVTDDARYDANSVLVAIADNTPVVQVFAASTLLGRGAAGNVTALTFAAVKTALEALGINASTLATFTAANLRDRTTHTGLQTSATISDFNAAADARAQAVVDTLTAGAPGALNTLDELAAALGDDANFAATVTTALGLRTRKFVQTVGDAAALNYVIPHNLGSTDVITQVRVVATNAVVECQIVNTDANNVTVSFNAAPALNTRRVTVIG